MRFFPSASLCLSLLAVTIPAFAQLPTGAVAIINPANLSGGPGALVSFIPDEVVGGPGAAAIGTQQPALFTDAQGFTGLTFDGTTLLSIPSLTTNYNNFTVLIAAKSGDAWTGNQVIAAGTRADGPSLYQYNGGISYYDQAHGSNFAPYMTQAQVQGEVICYGLWFRGPEYRD